jgi:hypothetical protein
MTAALGSASKGAFLRVSPVTAAVPAQPATTLLNGKTPSAMCIRTPGIQAKWAKLSELLPFLAFELHQESGDKRPGSQEPLAPLKKQKPRPRLSSDSSAFVACFGKNKKSCSGVHLRDRSEYLFFCHLSSFSTWPFSLQLSRHNFAGPHEVHRALSGNKWKNQGK